MSGKETHCSGALSVKETCCHWARLQQPTKIWHLCKRARKDQAYPKKPLPSDAAAYPHCNTRLHTNETNLCGTVCCSVLQCVEHHVCIVVHGVGVNGVGIQGRGAQDDKPKTRHCNTLLYSAINCNTLQHTATDCGHGMHGVVHQGRGAPDNTLQHAVAHGVGIQGGGAQDETLHNSATHCNETLHNSATHCNETLHKSATHCNTFKVLVPKKEVPAAVGGCSGSAAAIAVGKGFAATAAAAPAVVSVAG